jgi:hypothetical protein
MITRLRLAMVQLSLSAGGGAILAGAILAEAVRAVAVALAVTVTHGGTIAAARAAPVGTAVDMGLGLGDNGDGPLGPGKAGQQVAQDRLLEAGGALDLLHEGVPPSCVGEDTQGIETVHLAFDRESQAPAPPVIAVCDLGAGAGDQGLDLGEEGFDFLVRPLAVDDDHQLMGCHVVSEPPSGLAAPRLPQGPGEQGLVRRRLDHAPNMGAKTSEITAISLMRMLMEGPTVSLRGSPTVSPTTAAL